MSSGWIVMVYPRREEFSTCWTMASRWAGNVDRCQSGVPRSATSGRQAADLRIPPVYQRVTVDQTGTSIKCRPRCLRAGAKKPLRNAWERCALRLARAIRRASRAAAIRAPAPAQARAGYARIRVPLPGTGRRQKQNGDGPRGESHAGKTKPEKPRRMPGTPARNRGFMPERTTAYAPYASRS